MIVTPNHPVYGMTHRLFDADGFEVVLCLWADTETGEAVVAALEGGRITWVVDDTGKEVVRTRWISCRPPLALVRQAR